MDFRCSHRENQMALDLSQIASALCRGNEAGYAAGKLAAMPYMQETVAIRHVPSSPRDGLQSLEEYSRSGEELEAALRKSMPDLRQEEVSATVSGQAEITLRRTICGTLPSGQSVRIPVTTTYRFIGGHISEISPGLAGTDAEQLRRLARPEP
jgi:hypothetical protein